MENPFAGVQAALFDLDGTLVRTHIDFPLMKREMLALAVEFGLDSVPLQPLDILTVVEEARRRLLADGRIEEGERMRQVAFGRLEEIEAAQCSAPEEIAGASELLAALRELGIRVGIVTRNCRTVSRRLTAQGRLPHDALLTRDDVPLTKPNPEHLHAALRALEAPRGVMVGDHWMDVRAGIEAGLRTVGIRWGRPAAFFDPAAPDLLVDRLADLLPFVLKPSTINHQLSTSRA